MTEKIAPAATEEAGSIPVPAADAREQVKEEPRGFLRSGRKNLSEEDLATAAARRFLIAEIERLDQTCSSLKQIEDKYNDLRVEHASLTEKAKVSQSFEILFTVGIAAGSATLGAAPSFLSIDALHGIGWTFVVGSILFLVIAVIARVKR